MAMWLTAEEAVQASRGGKKHSWAGEESNTERGCREWLCEYNDLMEELHSFEDKTRRFDRAMALYAELPEAAWRIIAARYRDCDR